MKDWGVVVPIVTPCTPSGEVDWDGLRLLCQDMIDAGCSSIFVAGSSGRGPWFSRQDRERMCRTAVNCAGDEIPILAGCMASGLPGMLENARAMADAGAEMAVVTVPGYFNYSQAEAEKIFLKFADASPLPVVVYDMPDLVGLKLDVDTLLTLARHENVVGIKDSSADYPHFKSLLDGLNHLTDFYLLQGKERFLADSVLEGASGFVVSMVHIAPNLFVGLYRAMRSENVALARSLQAEIDKVMDIVDASFARRPETSTLFHLLSKTLQYRGVPVNLLMDHDGACPPWLAANARRASDICQAAGVDLLTDNLESLVVAGS
jgi:dihydrodipicolinate synthase/N-acetylneuraminate lyase